MLDDLKSQKVYEALKKSGGLSSPAAEKADSAISKANSLVADLESMTDLSSDSELPTFVPDEISKAVNKLHEYKSNLASSGSVAESLSSAIGQRMEDATSKMAVMNVAVDVANKMGEVEGGCGPIGAAFSVLTSQGRTDLLNSLMDQLSGPLSQVGALIAKYKNSLTGIMSGEDKALLAELMSGMAGVMASISEATAGIRDLVNEAQAMWGELETSFKQAIQASTLLSALNNPCMRAVADSIMPDEVKDVIDEFGL